MADINTYAAHSLSDGNLEVVAKKTIEKYYSDLSETEISGDYSPVPFAFDGVFYEIDLTDAEKAEFRKAFQKYIDAARLVSRPTSSPRKGASKSDAKAVRAWAAENDVDVPPRGRIPASVREQYEAATR